MENDTASLRDAAPKWTLAGDKQLLDILQNIHQSLMTRCQEVNRRLDEMVNALDDASVDLQNVNNKFMSLSNNQFIESRVYDDDVDVTKLEAPKEAPPSTDTSSELSNLIESTLALQRWHEAVQICDDSDSDSDDITSVVLKPKDVYSRRPLPHVIGTPAWKNKWHAGLLVEDSDTDSSTSKPAPDDEYSESEPDGPAPDRHDVTVTDTQGSSASSELFSEQDILPPVKSIISKPSPSDVAAELARRLRGEQTEIPEEDSPFAPPQPTTNKVYRPEQPTTGTIFSDEPPPFEQYQSESEPEDDDIFAELHKKPYGDANKVQSQVVDELFGGTDKGLFKQFVDSEAPPLPVANQKSTLFEDESEPELFVSKPTNKPTERRDDTTTETVKKPIGGISLFGTNKGAESIGAAILKRNRRKSSSEEESLSEKTKTDHKEDKLLKTTEKDIFDDLFAKSEKEQKVKKEKKDTVVSKEVKTDKVDLFSDNLFDNIDDIFTTDVKVITKPNNNEKSLFDDTEDDLFANIAVTENFKNNSEIKNKSIFDSDDDLFSDNVKPETKTKEVSETSKTSVSKTNEPSKKSIFDEDSSDGDIFTKLSETKVNSTKNNVTVEANLSKSNEESKSSTNTSNESRNTNTSYVTNNNFDTKIDKHKGKPPSLFDDDDDNDSDDIFKNSKNNTSVSSEKSPTTAVLSIDSNAKENKTDIKTKTSLFDEEDDDVLFKNLTKSSTLDETKNIPPVEAKTNDYNIFHTSLKDCDNNEKVDNISHNNNTEKASKDDMSNKIDASRPKSSIFDDDDNDTLFGDIKSSDKETSIPNKLLDSAPSPRNSNTHQNEIKASTKYEGESEINLNKNEKTMKPKATENSTINENNVKEIVKPDVPKPDFDNSKDNNTFFNTVNDAIFSTTDDIFSDLIDEPPAFEKPKEPKKSKNVNALFDDDSDDEALFFKKNDVIFDDKPDENADTNNDPMFGIFHNEPPAIDVDFTAKIEETVKNTSKTDFDDNLFKTSEKPTDAQMEISKQENNDNNNVPAYSQTLKKDLNLFVDSNSDSDNDLFQTSKTQKPVIATKPSQKDIKPHSPELKTKDEQIKKDEELEPTIVKPLSPIESQSSDTPDSPDIKKIGKLKTMSFNIDVSTLLPGASPKKKSVEQTDGQANSAKSKEDLHANVEESILKAVNFEGEPDSQILDNKISKERAKIQVKRRPSTRRARKEAVRKSVLDLGEDSTDNSSSFDDVPKEHRKTQNEPKHDDNKEQNETNKSEIEQIVTTKHKETNNENEIDIINIDNQCSVLITNENTNINVEVDTKTEISETNTRKDNLNNRDNVQSKSIKVETELNIPSITDVTKETKNVRSKVVYILNDEDIFNTPIEKPAENPKSIEDDRLFRNTVKIEETPSISTLGSVYKENKQDSNVKKSIFDDLSDEENELFNTNKKVLKTKSILDSDSEDDLFFGKKETKDNVSKEVKDVKPKQEVMKASLFGDDDDDDLFGAKVRIDQAPSQVRSKDVIVKPSQPVLDDPLSLLGDDDD